MSEGLLASRRCFTVQGHAAQSIRVAVQPDTASLSLEYVQPRRDNHPTRTLFDAPGIRLFEADTEETPYFIQVSLEDGSRPGPTDVTLTITVLPSYTVYYDRADRPAGVARMVAGVATAVSGEGMILSGSISVGGETFTYKGKTTAEEPILHTPLDPMKAGDRLRLTVIGSEAVKVEVVRACNGDSISMPRCHLRYGEYLH